MLLRMDPARFEEMYRLLQESLPADEYREPAGQRALLSDPRYTIYTPEDGTRALLAVWTFEGFTFVEHFAVDRALRGRGIGSDMLRALHKASDAPVCLEVDPPTDDISRRRVAFYARNGFILNPYPYLQPALGVGKKALPLCVMSAPHALSEEAFLRVKETLYTQVYQVKARFPSNPAAL